MGTSPVCLAYWAEGRTTTAFYSVILSSTFPIAHYLALNECFLKSTSPLPHWYPPSSKQRTSALCWYLRLSLEHWRYAHIQGYMHPSYPSRPLAEKWLVSSFSHIPYLYLPPPSSTGFCKPHLLHLVWLSARLRAVWLKLSTKIPSTLAFRPSTGIRSSTTHFMYT